MGCIELVLYTKHCQRGYRVYSPMINNWQEYFKDVAELCQGFVLKCHRFNMRHFKDIRVVTMWWRAFLFLSNNLKSSDSPEIYNFQFSIQLSHLPSSSSLPNNCNSFPSTPYPSGQNPFPTYKYPPSPPEVSWQSHFRWNSVSSHDSVAQVYTSPLPPPALGLLPSALSCPLECLLWGAEGEGCLPINRCANSSQFIEHELALGSIPFQMIPPTMLHVRKSQCYMCVLWPHCP